ncbi:hypothetical protein LSUE1_G003238 [Lachnellula suecica]|uniref:ATP-grasp domain-containing protein n=1 Tax=Lachnellula suecica TaxID=602035 RepID=A0A8T9CCX5_9HELO|nr:hypothetical protein LSUE1_G003238 [Lachnellula suecica]
MPLTIESPAYLHVLQNVSLIIIAISFIPLNTAILITSLVLAFASSFFKNATSAGPKHQSPYPAPKRILVTGVGMCKGLFLTRSFHKAGHVVIGADFEPQYIPVCGRFSSSLKRFYRLPPATGKGTYAESVLQIVEREKIDIWISCSGVKSAVEDGEAAEAVEQHTKCRAIQFGASLTQLLHEKPSFIQNTDILGLNVPETLLITSVEEGMAALKSAKEKKYILKIVGVEDPVRGDLTLLPLPSESSTRRHLSKFQPSVLRPFILQQFIQGPEYCTHSVIIRGRVAAFTACKSAELLMHYEPLPQSDPVFEALLEYTMKYAERMKSNMTGHFSVDILVDDRDSAKSFEDRLFPVECNPRAHTAVVNFGNQTELMVKAYLDVLSPTPADIGAFIPSSTVKHYWVGHDFITRMLLPVLALLQGTKSLEEVMERWREFLQHVLLWKDPTYDIHDPWPAWWLYCVYWPGIFFWSIVHKDWWSRCNVSTGRIFRC